MSYLLRDKVSLTFFAKLPRSRELLYHIFGIIKVSRELSCQVFGNKHGRCFRRHGTQQWQLIWDLMYSFFFFLFSLILINYTMSETQ